MTASRLGLADSWGSIQSIRFNQDSTAFVVSLDSGLRVFNVDPLRELSHYGADKVGSIARAEMLFRTNLLAVVSTSHQDASSSSPSSSTGGGPSSSGANSSSGRPLFADNAVMLFDAERDKFRMEFTFPSKVLSVRLKRDKLVAVCRYGNGIVQRSEISASLLCILASTTYTNLRINPIVVRIQFAGTTSPCSASPTVPRSSSPSRRGTTQGDFARSARCASPPPSPTCTQSSWSSRDTSWAACRSWIWPPRSTTSPRRQSPSTPTRDGDAIQSCRYLFHFAF